MISKRVFILALFISFASANVISQLFEGFRQPHDFTIHEPYSVSKSKALFYYSQVSKCPVADIQNWSCGFWCNQHVGMRDIQVFTNTSNSGQAFCGYNPNENLLIFSVRSSQDINNFLQDTKFLKLPFNSCPGCEVHRGFLYTYQDVQIGLNNCARTLTSKYPSAKITLTGHSLGGAVATLFAVDLHNQGYVIENLFTYGSPRVGNQAFFDYVKNRVVPQNSYRVTHNRDIVIHSPPMSFGYSHVTEEVWFNADSSSYTLCDVNNPEDSKCSNSVWATSISDHTSYHGNTLNCGDLLYQLLSQIPPQIKFANVN